MDHAHYFQLRDLGMGGNQKGKHLSKENWGTEYFDLIL